MFRIVAKRHFHAANLQKIIEKQNTSAVYLMQNPHILPNTKSFGKPL